MNKYIAIIGITLCSISSFAHAGGSTGPYVGLAYGVNSDVDTDKLSNQCGTGGVTCDDLGNTDDAWQFYGGYPVTDKIAVEGSYTNLVYVAKLRDSTGAQAEQKTEGVTLGLTGRQPLSSKLDVYGKIGAYLWNSETESTAGAADDSGTSPAVGVGLEYSVNDRWGVRGGWDRYFDIGKDDYLINGVTPGTLKDDIDTFTVGVNYNF
ncbi:MAG: outer membrane beta-barrel protein [Gammaproteobacteria bacterium]|nr:outer membrane beta-barrel protein [Gammaproteobacteria bacterium]MBU1725150.1 outer membrane beta-barrel protein [Gammaproteobacteria bacterium]MBU2004211.1 outer membrane beta-barrel protein [Gammaproteobacteria bacterium]